MQVDVNEWWSLDEALDAIPQLVELGVAYVEQPLPAADPGGEELRARSPIPIYVDEDCHTLADVAPCAEIAHGINIKLAKSGGIREAIRMAHAARALGLGVMLGCMVESGIGIAAGCVVAPLCDHVDLDGNLLLAEDPCPGVTFSDGVQVPVRGAGSRCRLDALLILAEGFSGDPHYGKTMHGVLRYRRDDVVAILDSTRAGRGRAGRSDRRRRRRVAAVPARRRRSSGSRPRAAGFRLPGGSCCATASGKGSESRTGCTSSSTDDEELVELAERVRRRR